MVVGRWSRGALNEATAAGRVEPPPGEAHGSWIAIHSVDIAFLTLIAAAFVHLLRITTEAYFRWDDWGLLHQGLTLRGLIEPYNDHLSVTILVVYRTLIEAFGFAYRPFQVAGLLALLGVPVAFYLTTRRAFGPPLAAVLAVSMPDRYRSSSCATAAL